MKLKVNHGKRVKKKEHTQTNTRAVNKTISHNCNIDYFLNVIVFPYIMNREKIDFNCVKS